MLDGVLVPGLVNAHAHLDLGGTEPLPAGRTFPDWLLAVGTLRAEDRDPAVAAEREARALGERGVVAAGDIDGSGGAGTAGRRAGGLAGLSYQEIVGLHPASARARLVEVTHRIERLGGAAGDLGVSPHAPYSVHGKILPEIVRVARARGWPLAMHLAESEEETRYLLHGDGPFVPFLEAIGRGTPFRRPPRVRPIEYAERAGLLEAGGVVIHGNDLSDDDVERLARHRSTVVYCHGTHRHFGRPPHRLGELMEAGVNVALGTDSGASNEGVDLLAELRRLAADRPDLEPLRLLRAATFGGRRALGREEGAATWEAGSVADAALFSPAPPELESMDARAVAEWVLSPAARLAATVHAGRRVDAPGTPRDGRAGQLDSVSGQG